MKFPVFDLHCDTSFELLGSNRQPGGKLRSNRHHIDLERAATLGGYCQCFACFTTPQMRQWRQKSPVEIFQGELQTILREIGENADLMALAKTPGDVRKNQDMGKMSAILTLEGAAGIEFDPARLEEMHRIGFRITSLGWNEDNILTGSHVTGGGLTDRGREFVKEAQRLGMVVDTSHISDRAFWDIMDMTQAPVVATHSNSRSVCPSSRNLTDDMFRQICATGGVAGLNLYSDFIGENATIDKACDHIFHFMELDPDGKHLALGGDLDGCDPLPKDFAGVQDYPKLAARLLERGLGETVVRNIFWENALGVMDQCCT